ncbi:28S ribosomal protein S9, mitochondrial-like [Penaeus japonicus]|uniref:28S ribosomal protein S9, mitochondrial-like n=1 Tax=Penaeus japonicus TaxID=27405 RepID=UPI001C70E5B7|nr:28S ribosomal protein S9, mitochondrial-like [Penaeus japonicus]
MSSVMFRHLLRCPGVLLQGPSKTPLALLPGIQGKCWNSNIAETSRSQSSETAVATGQLDAGKSTAKLSKAMKAYIERAKTHDAFMFEQISEYEIGRRHLANMMGEDPETFTQEDVDNAIAYLLPSGLFEPKARPLMKHPTEVFPKRKAAEFDESGRPFHTLFYTGRPAFYQVLHDVARHVQNLDRFADRMMRYSVSKDKERTLNLGSSKWVSKEQFEAIIVESIQDKHYEFFIKSMNRLIDHPYSYRVEEFIMKFRKSITSSSQQEIPKLMFTTEGVPYMQATGSRKTARANVTVYGRGTGKITINGQDILFFKNPQEKEQVIFPLQFTEMLGTVDVVAEVKHGGETGQAGAIRHGIALALRSFVDKEMVEKMRLAGLLTCDPRRRERKKPGQKGARAKFTWKKR